MRKIVLCFSLLVCVFVLPACHKHIGILDPAVEPTCTEQGLTEGSHCIACGEFLVLQETIPAKGHTPVIDQGIAATCASVGRTEGSHCAICNEVLVEQVTIEKTEHIAVIDAAVEPTANRLGLTEGSHCESCGAVLSEQEYRLMPEPPFAYYITEKDTVIENDRFVVTIEPNIYVPMTLEQDIHTVMDSIEQITGLSFYPNDLDKYYDVSEKRVIITVRRNANGQEMAEAAGGIRGAYVSPGDLLICAGEAWGITHELLHCINARNGSFMSHLMCEGFTTYFTQRIIEAQYVPMNFFSYSNYADVTFDAMTPETAEQCFFNVNEDSWYDYLYGFRFMHYLMETYGMDAYMTLSKSVFDEIRGRMYNPAQMAERLKAQFGDDIFIKFGEWYINNRDLFNVVQKSQNFEPFSQLYIFPYYAARDIYSHLQFVYSDYLVLDFENGFEYAKAYKNETLTGELAIKMFTKGHAKAFFYDSEGNLLATEVLTYYNKLYSVKNACKVLIVGDGQLIDFEPIFDEIVK